MATVSSNRHWEPAAMLDDVLKRIDGNLGRASTGCSRFCASTASPPTRPIATRAATLPIGWSANLPGIGFDASARATPGHPIVVGHHPGDGPARAFLRPLRCAAGRSARPVGRRRRSSRARHPARRAQVDRRARCRRRQGPADDLHRSCARLEGRDRQPAGAGHDAARRRGRIRQHQPQAVPRGERRPS